LQHQSQLDANLMKKTLLALAVLMVATALVLLLTRQGVEPSVEFWPVAQFM